MTHIYLIDDSYARHLQLKPLVDDLNAAYVNAEFTAQCPGNKAEAEAVATESTSAASVWQQVTCAELESIFLVDLQLKNINEENSYRYFLEKLENEPREWTEQAKKYMDILFDSDESLADYRTAVFACSVLAARKMKAILVSAVAGIGLFRIFKRILSIPAIEGRADPEWHDWKTEIDNLQSYDHPVQLIKRILGLYAQPIYRDIDIWGHNKCQLPESVGHGNHIWDMKGELSNSDNKALHQHCSDSDWEVPAVQSGPITKNMLEHSVRQLELGCEVECIIEASRDQFYFPRAPGILFLLSLKELVEFLSDKGPPKSLIFNRKEALHSVFVKLDHNESGGLEGILKGMLIKQPKTHETFAGTIRESIPKGGLSEAIFHFAHCRLGEIKGNAKWAISFRNGSKNWAMWPCLNPEGIMFYWVAVPPVRDV